MQNSLSDPSAYPRVYRLRRDVAWLWLLTGVISILGFGFGAVHFASGPMASENLRIFFFASCVLVALLGIFPILMVIKYRFVLDHDKVYLSTLLSRREMRLDDIAGLRRRYNDVGYTTTLVPKDPRSKRLKFADHMQQDEFFERWIASIPDLDDVKVGTTHAFQQGSQPVEKTGPD